MTTRAGRTSHKNRSRFDQARECRRLIFMLVPLMLAFHPCAAQDNPSKPSTVEATKPSPAKSEQPSFYVELSYFDNWVNNNYGNWHGVDGRLAYRGIKRFTPIFSFSHQDRPYGSQEAYGIDSYVSVSKWFTALVGAGGSPDRGASLYPEFRACGTGMISLPFVKGMVATVGGSYIRGDEHNKGGVVSVGAIYYHGKAIVNGSISFNRTYPGSIPSKSGYLGLQYGLNRKYWVGIGMGGGKVAYNLFALQPLDVRTYSFGPSFFLQKWIGRKWGIVLRSGYQNQLDFFQGIGGSAGLFFEFR